MTPRGLFIVLEGGEGVGKTTQWRALGDRLTRAGHDVETLREPGGTAAGDVIRALLLDPMATLTPEAEALLFAASRAQLVRDIITPSLARGAIVLVDRFLLSTYAYQGAGRGLSLDVLRAANQLATGGLAPDLTMLLSMPVEDAMARMHARGATDRMERESVAFHSRVAQAFLDATGVEWQAQFPEVGPVMTVQASGSSDDVTARCVAALVERWPTRFDSTIISGSRPAPQLARQVDTSNGVELG